MTFDNKKLLVPILAILVVSMTVGTAYAVTITQDKGIGCGPKNWGVKEYQNEDRGTSVDFGRDNRCSVDSTFHGRSNVAVIETEIRNNHPTHHIAWASIFQGEDPFGNKDNRKGANIHNTVFPINADEDFKIKVQWLWTNDNKPQNRNSDIYANFLTNLWLEKHNNDKKTVVIDLLVDRLENNRGNWVQDSISREGTTYYTPFCEVDDRGTSRTSDDIEIYHYGVIVDSVDNRAKNTWHEKTKNVSSYISNAFSATYAGSECSSNNPGKIGDFRVVDQEQGIELQTFTQNHKGAVKGAYSFSELWY